MGTLNCKESQCFSETNGGSELIVIKRKKLEPLERMDKIKILCCSKSHVSLSIDIPQNPQTLITPKANTILSLKKQLSSHNSNEITCFSQNEKITIDDFELKKVIGRGTYGKVYLAQSKYNNTNYAIKAISKEKIIKNKMIEKVINEKNILFMIDNPFIINLKFTFQSDDEVYFGFDYCKGGELFYHLKQQGGFSEDLARFYASEVYLAISYLHRNSIIYRDLKLENVMLDKSGHIKLIDFGLSKFGISNEKSTFTLCGTNQYMPPEAIKGDDYSFSFDWWNFANFIYEMVFGRTAFSADDRIQLFKNILEKEPDYSSINNLSEDLIDLLKKLFKKNVDERISPKEIPNHPWFNKIDFKKLSLLEIKPIFIPKQDENNEFLNISNEFLSQQIHSPKKNCRIPKNEIDLYFAEF